ncbi:Transmembrane protein 229B, partial [Stegodyphus mimosarum]
MFSSFVKMIESNYLSPFLRLYIYGIHGYFIEVMFTAVWEFVVNMNWKFPGCSSIWSLFIYAGCSFLIEQAYVLLQDRLHIILRGVIYLVFCYTWELVTGLVLQHFNACPWDYSEFKYNFHGLITLEYAPLWYIALLVQEQLLTKNMLRMQWKADQFVCKLCQISCSHSERRMQNTSISKLDGQKRKMK